jgi:ArsR family transcriptional regulator
MTTTIHPAKLAVLFHALSDETRLAIVQRLRGGERCVCDLTDLLDAAQSRLSFHLKVLRESGLVDCRREGRWAYYWLRPEAFELMDEASKALRPTRSAIASQRQCCA